MIFLYFGNMNLLSCVVWNFLLFESSRRQRCSWSFSDISPTKFSVKITSVTSDANFKILTLQFSDSDLKDNESKKENFLWFLDLVKSWVFLNKLPSENDPQLKINRQFFSVKNFNVPHNPPSDHFCGNYHLPKIHEQSLHLTDTGDNSKLDDRRKRPIVDTLFSSLFSDASQRRVWLSAESKILASTFGRFRMYRLKLSDDCSISLDKKMQNLKAFDNKN